jgi:integrase
VKKLWTVIRKKMGIDLRVHDLRHVFATMALEAGVPLNYDRSVARARSTVNDRALCKRVDRMLRHGEGGQAA